MPMVVTKDFFNQMNVFNQKVEEGMQRVIEELSKMNPGSIVREELSSVLTPNQKLKIKNDFDDLVKLVFPQFQNSNGQANLNKHPTYKMWMDDMNLLGVKQGFLDRLVKALSREDTQIKPVIFKDVFLDDLNDFNIDFKKDTERLLRDFNRMHPPNESNPDERKMFKDLSILTEKYFPDFVRDGIPETILLSNIDFRLAQDTVIRSIHKRCPIPSPSATAQTPPVSVPSASASATARTPPVSAPSASASASATAQTPPVSVPSASASATILTAPSYDVGPKPPSEPGPPPSYDALMPASIIKDCKHLIKESEKLPSGKRLPFIIQHQGMIKNSKELVRVLEVLSRNEKLEFATSLSNKDSLALGVEPNWKDIEMVLDALPAVCRLTFAKGYVEFLKDGAELAEILKLLPVTERLSFAHENQGKLHGYLHCVLAHLPQEQRLAFAIQNQNKTSKDWLNEVLNTLSDDDKLKFAKSWSSSGSTEAPALGLKIKTYQDLVIAVRAIQPPEVKSFLAKCYQAVLRNKDHIDSVSNELPINDRAAFKADQQERIANKPTSTQEQHSIAYKKVTDEHRASNRAPNDDSTESMDVGGLQKK